MNGIVWGVIWLIQAFVFFAAGIIVGLVSFKVRFDGPHADAFNDAQHLFSFFHLAIC